jgi:hypothetical protein
MALIDDAISTVNATLLANLTWLDGAYGKIQRMRHKDATGRETTFPGAYTGTSANKTNDYINVLPDEKLGNYCYWEVSDPVEYDNVNRNFYTTFNFKISFWFDWRDIFGDPDYKAASIEEIKLIILNVLAAAQYTRQVEAYKVYEDANSIFQNFTNQGYISSYDHKQIKGQFLMKPYGGLAFSGVIQSFLGCTSHDVVVTIPPTLIGRLPLNYSNSEQLYPLETWYGEPIYWRTWNLGSGANIVELLTGLTDSLVGVIVDTEYRAVNTVNNARETGKVQLVDDGSGNFGVFTPDFWTDIFVTAKYTK